MPYRVTARARFCRAGAFVLVTKTEYPLADGAEAHRALEGRRTTGKVLLQP